MYVGTSPSFMGLLKLSLHRSGVWVLAATKESGATFDGNRRAKRWQKPPEHYPGWTRGPSIVVPHVAGSKRPPETSAKQIEWLPAPDPGMVADAGIYFAAPGAPAPNWSRGSIVVGERPLQGGGRVSVVATYTRMSADQEFNTEWMTRASVLRFDREPELTEGMFMWVTDSTDETHTPLFIDLPVTASTNTPSAVIAAADPLAPGDAKPKTLAEWRKKYGV
jgi:hypothetical protein